MNRYLMVIGLTIGLFGNDSFAAESCIADGEPQFICGTTNPEDLHPVPGSPWIIASGRYSDQDGPIYAVHRNSGQVREIFPANARIQAHDVVTYEQCPGPSRNFQPHGIALRPGDGGEHTLYVVGHGPREAIEVFNLDMRGAVPSLQWIGCIPAPAGTRRLNSVAPLPDGSLAATNFDTSGGELWEWDPVRGWIEVEGSQMRGPNGLLSSPAGDWLYIGGWSDRALVRLSRGQNPVRIDRAPVGFNVDNIRWAPDGNIVVAGHVTRCPEEVSCELSAARVALVNPETLQVQQLIDFKGNDFFALGTVAIEVDDEIWIGGINGTLGIARFAR